MTLGTLALHSGTLLVFCWKTATAFLSSPNIGHAHTHTHTPTSTPDLVPGHLLAATNPRRAASEQTFMIAESHQVDSLANTHTHTLTHTHTHARQLGIKSVRSVPVLRAPLAVQDAPPTPTATCRRQCASASWRDAATARAWQGGTV